jgi:hypothetical protein
MRYRRLAAACAAAVLSVGATSCSSKHGAPSVPTAPSYNPRVAPSVAAYVAFITAADVARKHPPPAGRPAPGTAADFASHAIDPVRAQTVTYLSGLRRNGMAWRGTPPKPKPFVLSIRLDAKPYPAVTLGDCQVPSPSWEEYAVADGSAVPKSSTRYRVIGEVVMRAGHWVVTSVAPDPQHVCR